MLYVDGIERILSGVPEGSDKQIQYNDNGVFGGSSITYDKVNSRVGIGTSTPERVFHVNGNQAGGIALFSRTPSSASNLVYGTFNIRAVHDGDMGDGFGTALQFYIQDNSGVENAAASIQSVRNGADNTSLMQFATQVGGVSVVGLRVNGPRVDLPITASNFGRVGATYSRYFTNSGNVSTIETDLYAFTASAATLTENGSRYEGRYTGTFLGSTSNKRIRLYFGATAIFDSGALTVSTNAGWILEFIIIGVSSTTVRYAVRLTVDTATAQIKQAVGELTGITLTSDNTVKITGQASGTGAATDDIVRTLGHTDWYPAPYFTN